MALGPNPVLPGFVQFWIADVFNNFKWLIKNRAEEYFTMCENYVKFTFQWS